MKNSQYRKTSIYSSVLILALLLFVAPSHVVEIRKEITPNKLTVLQVERHNLPVVMITLLVKASPLNEPPGKAGVAYLTSKLLNEGTARRSSSAISSEIEFLGASLEASTSSDFTIVSLSVLKKDIDKGFDLFSDILLHPAFNEQELKRKKELLKGALRQKEEDPAFVANKTFIKEVFGSHPYGRLVEGSVESIDAIRREDVAGFYRRHYLPDNAILSVVGDLTPGELDALLDKYLSSWKAGEPGGSVKPGAASNTAEGTAVPAQKKVVLVSKDVTQATIMLGNLGIARSNPDYYAVQVMNYILGGGGFSSRLMRIVRDEMGLTYSINSAFVGNKEPGQFEVEVQTKSESAGTVIDEIVKQIRLIMTAPVTDRELSDAKAYLTGSFPRRLETSRRVADFLAAVQFYELGDDYIEKYPGYINAVTKDDVLRVAKKYLDPENYKLTVVGNEKKLVLDIGK